MKENTFLEKLDIYHVIQPIVNLKTNKVHGYEFLLRSQEYTNPELLFKIAMEHDYLFQLDMKSIMKVFEYDQARNIEKEKLFINVFPSTLIEPSFLDKFAWIVSQSNISPSSIVLELNEAEKNVDLYELKLVVDRIKEQGFVISVDDVGKGDFSFKAALEIEPDIIKIDRYFSEELSISTIKQEVITHFLQLLNNKASFVLEGIEKEKDMLIAKKLGVHFGQGFYLGRPNSFDFYLT